SSKAALRLRLSTGPLPGFDTVTRNVAGCPITPAAGPAMLTFSPGCVTCVVAHFSSLRPSSVSTVAQVVTAPRRADRKTTPMGCAWPGGSRPSVQTSWPALAMAGGLERSYCRPSGSGLVTVIERDSTLPLLATVMVYGTSWLTPATAGPV